MYEITKQLLITRVHTHVVDDSDVGCDRVHGDRIIFYYKRGTVPLYLENPPISLQIPASIYI